MSPCVTKKLGTKRSAHDGMMIQVKIARVDSVRYLVQWRQDSIVDNTPSHGTIGKHQSTTVILSISIHSMEAMSRLAKLFSSANTSAS